MQTKSGKGGSHVRKYTETFRRGPRVQIPPGRAEPAVGASLASGEVANSAKRRQLVQMPCDPASKEIIVGRSLSCGVDWGRVGVSAMVRGRRSARGRRAGRMH